MAITVISADRIGSGTQFTFAANGDGMILLEGVTVASTEQSAIRYDLLTVRQQQ